MKLSKPLWAAVALLIVAGVAYAIYSRVETRHALPEGLIQANGRIEGDHVTIASKLPGRIAELNVREGDTVAAGQILAVLDATQIDARVAQAGAAVHAVQAQHRATQTALLALRKQVPLEVASATTGVAQAEAAMHKARAASEQSERDATRLDELAARGSVPVQRAEMARLAAVASQADVEVGEQALVRARKLVAEAHLGEDRIRAKLDEVEALDAGLAQARSALAEVESLREDLSIKAPGPGVVVARIRAAGEVIAAGSPIVDLVDLDRLYLKVYVPESQIGQLRLGLPAQITIDALPDQTFPARLTFISPRAEFTPKEVQTADERVKLVYAVKLHADANPQHRLSPGMPADAMIRYEDSVAWQRPTW